MTSMVVGTKHGVLPGWLKFSANKTVFKVIKFIKVSNFLDKD